MSSTMRALVASALLAMAQAQGVIIKAQGPAGPASPGLLVDQNKRDANIINKKEIVANVVNECGRTILMGNIDIGEETENQLGNNTVTQFTKGSNVEISIAQVSAEGAGPYTCDLDLTSNSNGASGQTKLTVKESPPQKGIIKLNVKMPDDVACVGASAGNVCTIRCFNNNAKGPFGGCVAVQQTDITPKQNTPANIPTAAKLDGVIAQIKQDNKDFEAAVKSNQEAETMNDQGLTNVKELLPGATTEATGSAAEAVKAAVNPPSPAAAPAAPAAAAPATPAPAKANNGGKAKGGNRGKGKGKGLAGFAALLGGGGGGGKGKRPANKRAPEELLSSRLARRNMFARNI